MALSCYQRAYEALIKYEQPEQPNSFRIEALNRLKKKIKELEAK